MREPPSTGIRLGRRGLIAGAAVALSAPAIRPSWAADRSLTVSTYGGFFEDGFREHVHPAFTRATGIKVVSQPQAEGTQFLIQLALANKGGQAPMDLSLNSEEDALRGRAQGVWRPFNTKRIANLSNVAPSYVLSGADGVDAVGALAFFMTLVINPDAFKAPPDSWTALWAPGKKIWGLNGGGASVLFELTAAIYCGGTQVLNTRDGIDAVGDKMAELKPRAKLWWTDEGTMQTALQNDEVSGGTYYHDVAGTMARAGTDVVSIFPKEGAYSDFSSWCQPTSSTKIDEALEFINFTCTPEAQQLIARHVGSAPVIPRGKLDLTDAEFAAVSNEATPIRANAAARVKHSDYFEQVFTRVVTTG